MNNKERIQEIRAELTAKLDARDQLFAYLQDWFDKYGSVPLEYLPQWNTYQYDKRPWREIPGMLRRVQRIAKRLYRNEQRTPDARARQAKRYVARQMRKLGRSEPSTP